MAGPLVSTCQHRRGHHLSRTAFGPAILFSCIVVLTGDVYYDKADEHGQLKRWSSGNKVAAVIILAINLAITFAILTQRK